MSGRIQGMEARKAELGATLTGLLSTIDRLRESREAAYEALTEAKIKLANAEQRESALLERRQPIEARLEELRNTIARAQQSTSVALDLACIWRGNSRARREGT